jgi:hypothetical protein
MSLKLPFVAVMPSNRTYEMIIPASKQLSSAELHQLRQDIDHKYHPHTKVDQIGQSAQSSRTMPGIPLSRRQRGKNVNADIGPAKGKLIGTGLYRIAV